MCFAHGIQLAVIDVLYKNKSKVSSSDQLSDDKTDKNSLNEEDSDLDVNNDSDEDNDIDEEEDSNDFVIE